MSDRHELPLLTSARREAVVAFGIWLSATIYSVGYCCAFGFGRDAESLTFVVGFPDWVFWGIVLPWGLCTICASLFAFFFMSDEDLDGTAITRDTTCGSRAVVEEEPQSNACRRRHD